MKQYTQNPICERYDINKDTNNLASQRTSQASTAAQARFSLGVYLDTHISPHTNMRKIKTNTPDINIYQEVDDLLEQSIHEWATWLITTELRHAQMQNKYRKHYTPIEFPEDDSTADYHTRRERKLPH